MLSITTYKELYQISPVKAREKLISIYNRTKNMRKTAKILSCSVSTVSKFVNRAINKQTLENLSRAPKNPKRSITDEILKILKEERIKTNLGRRRLTRHLKEQFSIIISDNTTAYWLRRLNLARPCKQRARYKGVSYYNLPKLKPLQHWQIDTKDIRDSKTLPKEVYRHLIREKLPRYQFTAIDVKTRIKLLAYAYNLNRTNGIAFIKLIINWLRANGLKEHIYIQTDWGIEYGGHSVRTWFNLQRNIFQPRNSTMLKIRKSRWTDNAYVERTHRTDDEEFYIPKLQQINNIKEHFEFAFGYVSYFNTVRPHYGKHMNGLTPWLMLHKLNPVIPQSICYMPPLILDFVSSSDLFIKEESCKQFATFRGVRDVFDTYFMIFYN